MPNSVKCFGQTPLREVGASKVTILHNVKPNHSRTYLV